MRVAGRTRPLQQPTGSGDTRSRSKSERLRRSSDRRGLCVFDGSQPMLTQQIARRGFDAGPGPPDGEPPLVRERDRLLHPLRDAKRRDGVQAGRSTTGGALPGETLSAQSFRTMVGANAMSSARRVSSRSSRARPDSGSPGFFAAAFQSICESAASTVGVAACRVLRRHPSTWTMTSSSGQFVQASRGQPAAAAVTRSRCHLRLACPA